MMKKNAFFTVSLIFSGIIHLFAQGIPPKPEPAVYANDFAGMMPLEQVSMLEDKLSGYFDSTSTQIVLVTVNSLGGKTVESYAVELAQSWGIGQQGKDNGLLILIAKNERLMRIEVGYGLEGLIPDLAANSIIENQLKPKFKEGKFYEGLDEATTLIFKILSGEFKADAIPLPAAKPLDTTDYWMYTIFIYVFGLSGLVFLLGFLLLEIYRLIPGVQWKKNAFLREWAAYSLSFILAHGLVMYVYGYYEYLIQIFLGDMVAGLLAYLITQSGSSGGGGGSYTYSSSSSSSSSSSWGGSSSSSSSSYSSSSSGSSSFGGGSFGGGGASGSW